MKETCIIVATSPRLLDSSKRQQQLKQNTTLQKHCNADDWKAIR